MMKTIPLCIVWLLVFAIHAHAQLIVSDPALNTQSIINQAQSLVKYVEMIDNQVQQINSMTKQLQELQNYTKVFGDPSLILNVVGANGLIQGVQNDGVGQTISSIQNLSHGIDALVDDANGVYHRVDSIFTTPNGTSVNRNEDAYRPFAAVIQAARNFSKVYDDVLSRRKILKTNIAAATQALQSATTASETQKLTGVLTGLNSALASTDKELDQALGLQLVQDSQNRNDEKKQEKARAEEQQAEFSESIQKYGDTMKLSVEAPVFQEINP
jgi:P-type conjugative transfer protein TrbJ